MSEDKNNSDVYLDIITQILNKKKITPPPQDHSVDKLYETVNMVVSDLDVSIKESKIHRKYEIMINDLQKRIRFLEEKIKEQHRARSPSKKYVEDLLDKLIKFKFENQSLTSRINALTAENQEIKAKIKIYEEGTGEGDKKKESVKEKQEELQENKIQISGSILKNQVTTFMKLKQNLRRHQKQEKTSFERFLRKSQDKFENWSMRQFLSAIQKWTIDFYESGMPRVLSNSKRTKEEVRTSMMKPTGNSFRLRSKKAISIEYPKNNVTLYENILR